MTILISKCRYCGLIKEKAIYNDPLIEILRNESGIPYILQYHTYLDKHTCLIKDGKMMEGVMVPQGIRK